MAKIVVLLFFALFVKNDLVTSLVTDYRIISWNSEGFRLQQVFNLFVNNPNLDFAFVQESGNIATNVGGYVVPATNQPEFNILDAENIYTSSPTGSFELRIIQQGNIQLYVYYFPAAPNVRTTISLTIVSRHLATEILYFPSQHRHRDVEHDTSFTNRPVAGVAIGNDVFLTIHAEPNRNSNEVLLQLNEIRNHMLNLRPRASWLLVGDFNRLPENVRPRLTPSERLVSPPQNTRRGVILDYLIYGSPDANVLTQMNNARYQGAVTNALQGSDHSPVYFTNYLTSIEYDANNLQEILDQACTRRQSRYKNWKQFYSKLPTMKDDIPSMGFMDFSDGSYVQPIVAEGADNISASSNWRPLDLSVFIGLAVVSVHSVKEKRDLSAISNRYHGMIFMDRNQHPIVTVFLKNYNLLCLSWTKDGWSTPVECDRANELASTQQGRTFSRCHNQGTGLVIGQNLQRKDKEIIVEYNLNILQREFERTVRGDGFYRKDYDSWRDYYVDKWQSTISSKGEDMSGTTHYLFSNYWNYGYYFNDGSFCIGFHSKHIREDDRDNWLFINDNGISSWTRREFAGMFFFDKFGRPVAFAVGARGLCEIVRCFWVYEYDLGNKWTWIEGSYNPSTLSHNTKALRFTIDTNNLH